MARLQIRKSTSGETTMKKLQFLAASLALTGATVAQAQTSVQIYGLIDTAVEHVTNVNTAGNSITRMANLSGGLFPSRIGYRGTEDLGDGLKAIFTLETGLAPDSGVLGQGGRIFGRQAWVGLSNQYGAVTLGRNYSMLFLSFFDVDNIGPSQFAASNLDTYLPNARADNSIAYKGTFNGFTVGATYSLGRDASAAGGPAATNCPGESATDHQACRNWSALARYDGGNWALLAAYDTFKGGAGASAAFSPTSSALSDSRTHVAGFYKLGATKLSGGFLRRDNEGSLLTPRSDLMYLGLSYDLTPLWLIEGQVSRIDFKNSPNDTKLAVVRALYSLSKRTAVYAMVGHIDNNGAAAIALNAGGTAPAGGSQNGVLAGIKHSF
jgi:predicted porin